MNVESELKDIINRLYDIQDVSGPDLSKKIYEIILQCQEAIGYRKAELDRVQSSHKPIKSSVRDDFARGLQMIMKHEGAEFAEGSLEDNMTNIYDNYVSQYYADELKEKGGVKVATDWFRNTYPDDEEGIFIHNSRNPIKSSLEDRLVPYLEEFEEGYANALASTDEMGPEVRLDTFYEIFKSDHNLSDDDINKLKDSVEGIWEESKEM